MPCSLAPLLPVGLAPGPSDPSRPSSSDASDFAPPAYCSPSPPISPLPSPSPSLRPSSPSPAAPASLWESSFRRPSLDSFDLPVYSSSSASEPPTLARSFFRWGFLLPLLWVFGALILHLPLQPVDESEEPNPRKRAQITEMLDLLRVTELRWATRCVYALVAWTLFVLLTVLLVLFVLAGKKEGWF